MPGPYTSGAELQLVSGFNSLIVCKRTKAQSFSVTNKRFLTNEAITAAMQNLPDAMNPAPNRYTIKSQFDLSERRGVVRRPNSRAAAGTAPASLFSSLNQTATIDAPLHIHVPNNGIAKLAVYIMCSMNGC